MAAEMAVESTVKEEIIQTMVKEEASEKREASTEKDVHSERIHVHRTSTDFSSDGQQQHC
jgi:hypothetical protein